MIKIAKDEMSAINTVDLMLLTVVLERSFLFILDSNSRTTDAVMKETITITINTLAHGREYEIAAI